MLTPPPVPPLPPALSCMRHSLRVLCLMAMAIAPLLATTPLRGQGVTPAFVTVVVRDTSGAPLLNAIVELTDPAGGLLMRRLTDAAGSARLPQPTARTARIDVRRLGFRRQTLDWRDGTERVSVRLVPVTPRLARVEVREAPSRCQPGFIPFDADTTLRQVIDAIDVYARQEAALDELFPWIADWTFSATDHSADDRILATHPSRQYTVDSRRDTLQYARGRMVERRGLTWIKVRHERVRDLTLPEFLANHCFALAEAPDTALGRPALHLRFRTDKAVRSTDSDGSVYLDPETLAPRKAIFRGANVPIGFSDYEEVVRFCEVTPGVLAPVQRRFWQSYSRPLFVRDVPVEWSRGLRTMLSMRWHNDVPSTVPQPSLASCGFEPAP